MRSFLKLQSVDPGFRADGILTAGVQLPATRYDIRQATRFFDESLARVSALPGVRARRRRLVLASPVRLHRHELLARRRAEASRTVSCRRARSGRSRRRSSDAGDSRTSEGAISLRPTPSTRCRSRSSVEELVSQQFPDGNPIGRRLRVNVNHGNGKSDVEWTIVGVVGNIRSTLDGPVRQTIFLPLAQRPTLNMRLFVRAEEPAHVASSVTGHRSRDGAASAGRDAAARGRRRPHHRPTAGDLSCWSAAFALVALALAAIGVYGVMAYSVRERTQEIGIRMALGASAQAVRRLMLGQALRLVSIGVVVGLVATSILTRFMVRLLFEIQPLDPWTLTTTALLLIGVATIAAYVPARRGTRLSPVTALRSLP